MEKKIYIVGGYVRDTQLGLIPSDIDYVAVGHTPKDFAHLQKVGLDFPVFLDKQGQEIALARIERSNGAGYNDFDYETDSVTLEDDLARRDLTINSMAMDSDTKGIIDPFDGLKDLESRTLRHTSEAFKEDPLRVLRLARIRAKLPGYWKIAASTKAMIYSMREDLTSLTQERVWKEVDRALECNPRVFFETLFELGVLDIIFPNIYQLTTLKEGSQWHMESSVFVHTMQMVEAAAKEGNKTLTLAALYHDIAKPHCYRTFGNGQGHDEWDLVKKFMDIKMPRKYQNALRVVIGNHLRIANFLSLRPAKQIKLVQSYRRDEELLNTQISLLLLDDEHREVLKRDILPVKLLAVIYEVFEGVNKYSPYEWLKTQVTKPTPIQMQQRVIQDQVALTKRIIKETL